jgi:hypothetical protein
MFSNKMSMNASVRRRIANIRNKALQSITIGGVKSRYLANTAIRMYLNLRTAYPQHNSKIRKELGNVISRI